MGNCIVFIFGLIIGSFLNVCIYRIPRGESIVFPASHCPICGQRIKWYDLIPVISYALLRGKCRNCGERISLRYPLVELLTAVIFTALYVEYGITVEFAKFIILSGTLIIIGYIDYETTDIYLKNTLPAIISGVFFAVLLYINGGNPSEFLYGAFLSYSFIALIALTTKGMGLGDAEVCMLCGLYLGFRLSILMLFLSFIFAGIAAVILLLKRKKEMKSSIAFGPYIAGSAIFTSLFGDRLLILYTHGVFGINK